ncbi:MAG TPA: glycosyltransferase family 4 protein [Acidimicrobiales bacterium]
MSRILHVPTVSWTPHEGVSRAIAELASATPWHEHHVFAAACDTTADEIFDRVVVQPGWMGSATFTSAVRDLIVTERPDIVHLHGGALVPLLAASPYLRDVPVVATIYGPLVPLRDRNAGLGTLLHARGASVSPLQVLVTSLIGPALGRWALRSGRIATVCTPDPLVEKALSGAGRVVAARGAASIGPHRAAWSDPPTIGFAGRAERGRGVEDLVAAFELVTQQVEGVRLRLLLLHGRRDGWVARLERMPGVDVVMGGCDDLARELASCQVVALPFRRSMTMTPTLVAAEALAAGVPVVGTDVPCLTPLLTDRVTGRIVRRGDVPALADALRWVLADRERWARLSAAAIDHIADEWSWSGAALGIDEVYSQVCKEQELHDAY